MTEHQWTVDSELPNREKVNQEREKKLQECTEEHPIAFFAEDMTKYLKALGVTKKRKVTTQSKQQALKHPYILSEERVYFGGLPEDDRQPDSYQVQAAYSPDKKGKTVKPSNV